MKLMRDAAVKILKWLGLFCAGVFLLGAVAFLFYVFLISLLFGLVGALLAPFTGFTFTDTIDFAPVGVIALVFVSLAVRHAACPHSEQWVRFARRAVFVFAVLPPMVYLAVLYAASYVAARHLGHFPRAWIDDPKNILGHDAPFQRMRHIVNYSEAFAGALVWAWGLLLLHLHNRFTPKEWAILAVLFFGGWIALMCEPGARLMWWLD